MVKRLKMKRPVKKVKRMRFKKYIPNGIPNTFITKMRYCQIIELDSSVTGNSVTYPFRANSLYDPDVSLIDPSQHQPMYRDEFALLYRKYCVLKSTIKMTPVVEGSISAYNQYYGIAHGLDYNEYNNISFVNLMEQKSTTKIMRTNSSPVGAVPISKLHTATASFSLKKHLQKDSKDDTVGSVQAGNAALAYYFVPYAVGLGSTEPAPTKYMIEIVYTVKLFEHIQAVQS